MDMHIDLSIIIPFYNAEDYVKECLESIIRIRLLSIEIICIDDGSTDKTLQFLKEYADIDSRIIVLQQENLYAGMARNKGIGVARGKYITFIDADDILYSVDTLQDAYKIADERNCDFFACSAVGGTNIDEISPEEWVLKKQYFPQKEVFNVKDLGIYATYCFGGAPWSKLYRREFLENLNIKFPSLPRSEDFCFVELFVFLANRISYLDKPLIFHRKDVASSLESTKDKTPTIFWEAAKLQIEEFKKHGRWEDFQRAFKFNHIMGIEYHLNSMKTGKGFNEVFQCIKYEVLPFLESIEAEPDDEQYRVSKSRLFDIIKYDSGTDYLLARINKLNLKIGNYEMLVLNEDLENNILQETYDCLQLVKKELADVNSGLSFKIGRIITWLPRKLLGRK